MILTNKQKWMLDFIEKNEPELKRCRYYIDESGEIAVSLIDSYSYLNGFAIRFLGPNSIDFWSKEMKIDQELTTKFFNKCVKIKRNNSTDFFNISTLQSEQSISRIVHPLKIEERIGTSDAGGLVKSYYLTLNMYINEDILITPQNLKSVRDGDLDPSGKKIFKTLHYDGFSEKGGNRACFGINSDIFSRVVNILTDMDIK